MQWTDNVLRYEALSGPVAVNGSVDRWCLNELDLGEMRLAAEEAVAWRGEPASAAWNARCRDVPTSGQPADVRAWIEGVLRLPTGAQAGEFSRPIRFLVILRLRRVLLFPAAAHMLDHPCDPGRVLIATDGRTAFERDALDGLRGSAHPGALLMSCTPMHGPDDVCEEALLGALGVARGPGPWQAVGGKVAMRLFRSLEGRRRSDGSMVQVVARAQEALQRDVFYERGARRFGSACDRPDALPWLAWYELASDETTRKDGYQHDRAFADWLEYLASLGSIPLPGEISRSKHVIGAKGFCAWLSTRATLSGGNYAKRLTALQGLFGMIVAEGSLSSIPIHDDDIPRGKPANNKSTKAVLPRPLKEAAREIVRELLAKASSDFHSLSEQVWSPAGRLVPGSADAKAAAAHGGGLPDTLLMPGLFKNLLVTLRGADGQVVRLINPVLPTHLLFQLKVPLRGGEVLSFDSGEADERMPHVELNSEGGTEEAAIRWAPNTHPLATAGRRQGAICQEVDPDLGRLVSGFWANTNKSQPGGHSDGADRGRFVPYEDAELLGAFYFLGGWQGQLNPIDRFYARDDLTGVDQRVSNGLKGKLPGYTYLFRLLRDDRLGLRHEPAKYGATLWFFQAIMAEAEQRLIRRDEGGAGRPPLFVVQASRRGRQPLRCAYSPHCLRVTGITELLAAGVPLAIVSQVVAGHQSYLMTLYYDKHVGPAMVVDALREAASQMADGTLERVAAEASSMTAAELDRRFVFDPAAGALQGAQIPGFWLPMVDGVCPNGATLCHQGGPFVEGSEQLHAPVEGGSRNCGLCRFFLTGPDFLCGQVEMVNAHLHKARRQAKGMPILWEELRNAPSPARRSRVNDRIAHLKDAIDMTFKTIGARVRLLHKSQALAKVMARHPDAPGSDGGSVLITRMAEPEVFASLRQASELGSLDRASRVSALVPELDIQDAPIERNALIDRLLDENGLEGMLYRLPAAQARAVGDAFTDALRSIAPAGTQPGDYLDAISEGRVRLFDPDVAGIAAEMSRAMGARIEIRQRLVGALQAPWAGISDAGGLPA